MRLVIQDHYEDVRHSIEGDEQDIRTQLLELYPWLLAKFGNQTPIEILVRALDKSQGASARLFGDLEKSTRVDGQGLHVIRYPHTAGHGQVATTDAQLERYCAAAEFLTGHPADPEKLRQALIEADGDPIQAVLLAYDLPTSSVGDLKAVVDASFQKSEEEEKVSFKEVVPATDSAKKFAEAIARANTAGEIQHIKLGAGRHNKGMLGARDPETSKNYILKPGSGHQNSLAAGTSATQSKREAAFYAAGAAMGLGEYMPECHLLLLDGTEYACMVMLPQAFRNMNDLKAHDPNLPKRLLSLYNDGTTLKWAAMDYVLGNPDRHAGNVMASGDQVKLIDHGSTLAGDSFSPATDGVSFIPYYLRPGVSGFKKMSTDDKLRYLPRLSAQKLPEFQHWLLSLSGEAIGKVLEVYGIDPGPCQRRLDKLQHATSFQTADLAVLSAWVVG